MHMQQCGGRRDRRTGIVCVDTQCSAGVGTRQVRDGIEGLLSTHTLFCVTTHLYTTSCEPSRKADQHRNRRHVRTFPTSSPCSITVQSSYSTVSLNSGLLSIPRTRLLPQHHTTMLSITSSLSSLSLLLCCFLRLSRAEKSGSDLSAVVVTASTNPDSFACSSCVSVPVVCPLCRVQTNPGSCGRQVAAATRDRTIAQLTYDKPSLWRTVRCERDAYRLRFATPN